VVVQKRHNGPCAGEERLTDKDFFNGPLVKDRLSYESFKIIEMEVMSESVSASVSESVSEADYVYVM